LISLATPIDSDLMTGPKKRYSKGVSLLIVLVAYVTAILAGIYIARLFDYQHSLIDVAIADIAATIVIFIFSFLLNNSSMYDPYWSVIPIPIAYYWMMINPEGNSTRQWIIFLLVTFWGIRLTFNWVRGWPGLHHEDWRYVDLVRKHGKLYWLVSFSGIHMFPTILVYAGMVPVVFGMASKAPFNLIDYLAIIVTFSAVLIEWISDEQLKAFKLKVTEKGAFIKSGLWAYSRHPNYFGEVSFWFGLFLFAFAKSPFFFWTGIGALVMIILFVFISIPLMDERHQTTRIGYGEHMKKVSGLAPWFKRG